MTITPERLAAIRGLGDDEFRDVLIMDDAVEELLGEVDSLRTVVRALTSLLRDTVDRVNQGSVPNVVRLSWAATAADEVIGKVAT